MTIFRNFYHPIHIGDSELILHSMKMSYFVVLLSYFVTPFLLHFIDVLSKRLPVKSKKIEALEKGVKYL